MSGRRRHGSPVNWHLRAVDRLGASRMVAPPETPLEHAMTVTKDDVLASLARVACPDGTPLHRSAALSDVLATDGKVFFSITVDAGEVKAWEPVRKRAEEVVRAIPGVTSALVALTAERKAGAAAPRPAPGRATPPGAAPRGEATVGVPGVEAIIAVASGKGGVGKSTTAVNL